jgi:translocation and assembly module TamA
LFLALGCGGEKAEGRPWVRNVSFEGVKSVKVGDLAGKLAIEQTSWLRLRKRYLDPFAIEIDRERIEAYYRAHGFFNARVTTAEVVPWKGPKDKPTAVDVRFVVEEGQPTRLTAVTVDGLADVETRDKLEKQVHKALPTGEVFDHGAYLRAKSALEDALKHLGHAWAKVDGQVEVDRDTREARAALKAEPGVVAHFGHVHIEGEERVSGHRVALHAGLTEGERFRPDLLEAARGKIYNLGVFSSVRIDYVHGEQDPAMADVVVHVREGTFNEVRLGLGFGIESQRTDVHASVVYLRRNWLGGLRTLKLRLEPAYVAVPAFWNVQRNGPALVAEAQLIQPDWPLPLGQLKATLGYDVGIEYAYQYHGPRLSLALQRGFWRERVLLGVSYNFQLLQFFNTDPTILDNPALAGRLFGYTNPYRLGWLQGDAALDLRDRPLDPHRGVYLSTTIEAGGEYAGGAFLYEKIAPDLRGYAPLGNRVTLAGRFVFGQLWSQGDLGSPITRRFYLGGPNSHRGFNYNRLSPQVPSGIPGVQPIPIGGDQMVLLSVELRVNVFRLFDQWVALAGFVDGGDVGGPTCAVSPTSSTCTSVSTRTSVDWGDLNWAVGGGIRYRTIIGTIRFDVGARLNRLTPTEPDGTPNADPGQRFAFHLSVGEAF